MAMSIRERSPRFVAEVTGVSLSRPVDSAAVEAIQEAIDRFGVLIFPGQTLEDDQQIAFSLNFGALENTVGFGRDVPDMAPEISDLSNVNAAGERLFVSTNEGQSWAPISEDLTRNDPSKLGASTTRSTRRAVSVE